MAVYELESVGRFRDRVEELGAIEDWCGRQGDPRALLIHGRRRVGKSWLFRAFAHDRGADIFVASTRALGDQLAGFAAALERDGERPALADLESVVRLLYRPARDERRLAVIDELPNLVRVDRELPPTLLRVMEEEAAGSRLKLILTGSHVAMMEEILAERQPSTTAYRACTCGPSISGALAWSRARTTPSACAVTSHSARPRRSR